MLAKFGVVLKVGTKMRSPEETRDARKASTHLARAVAESFAKVLARVSSLIRVKPSITIAEHGLVAGFAAKSSEFRTPFRLRAGVINAVLQTARAILAFLA